MFKNSWYSITVVKQIDPLLTAERITFIILLFSLFSSKGPSEHSGGFLFLSYISCSKMAWYSRTGSSRYRLAACRAEASSGVYKVSSIGQ